MRICLYEDQWETLAPLSATRPVFELLCGMTSLGEKQRRCLGATDWGVCIRPALAPLFRRQWPELPINEYGWLLSSPMTLVNGRWLPPQQLPALPHAPCIGLADGHVALAVLTDEQLAAFRFHELAHVLSAWRHELPCIDVGGRLIDYPWQLVDYNGAALGEDFAAMATRPGAEPAPTAALVGPAERYWAAPTSLIEPMV